MGVLRDNRQEAFAQAIALGNLPQGECYTRAGYTARSANVAFAGASRLLSRVMVADRVRELQAEKAAKSTALAICDRNTRLSWLNEAAMLLLGAIRKEPDKPNTMYLRELRATQEQAARELGQWDVPAQPQVPAQAAEGAPRGFVGTLETLMVKLERYTVQGAR